MKTESIAAASPQMSLTFDAQERHCAIARCIAAKSERYEAEIRNGATHAKAEARSLDSYIDALPPLTGIEYIRDFIACVEYGSKYSAIYEWSTQSLLYVAQVALAAYQFENNLRRAA